MARRAQAPKAKKKAQVKIELSDFQYPKESVTFWQAYGGVTIVFIWLAMMGYFFTTNPKAASGHYWQWVYLLIYPIVAVFLVNWISARPRRKQMKEAGSRAKVMGNNFPELYKLVADACRTLCMDNCPDMYVLEDRIPYLYGLPGGKGTILLSTAMAKALNGAELAALLGHELGHFKAKHLRMEMALTWLRSANAIVKVALFPVTIMSFLLRGWMDLIDFTADRAAVIVTGNPALLNAALLKLAVALDPQAEITGAEVDEYLRSQNDMQSDSKQMERYFRVGQFIGKQPGLRERVEQIGNFPSSEQGKIVIEKLRELRGTQQQPNA